MIFRDADCGAVPVLEDGKPVGVLTDRDVALALAELRDRICRPARRPDHDHGTSSPSRPTPRCRRSSNSSATMRVRRLLVDRRRTTSCWGSSAWADIAHYASDRKVGQVVTEVVEQP